MSTLNKVIILFAISVLFSCNDEDAFSIDPDAVNSTSGGSGIAGAGVADDPGNISTAVANLSIFSNNVAKIDGVPQPLTREVMMSDDGNVILVVTDEDIVANNADGLHQIYQYDEGTKLYTQLTNFSNANNTGLQEIDSGNLIPVDLVPVLSGDGFTIAFIHTYDPLGTNVDGSPELFIIDVSSGVISQPTSDLFTEIPVFKPSITDDGSTVAFVSADDYTTGNPNKIDQIFTITTDGSNTINQITDNQVAFGVSRPAFFLANNDIDSSRYHILNFGLVISGDGSRIAFKGASDWLNNNVLDITDTEIYYINIDGSGLTLISAAGTNFIGNPQISDDGNKIVFSLSDGSNTTLDPSNLYLYNVATDTTINLTNSVDDIRFYDFALSGDGSQVIYRWEDNIRDTDVGSLDLVTVTTDGLSTRETIFSIPSQPIEDISDYEFTFAFVPDFIGYPKTTADGSKTVFATEDYRLPPANNSTAASQLYMAIKP